MKKVALLVLFSLAVPFVSSSGAQKKEEGKQTAKDDVTGTWKAMVDVGGQTGEPVFTLKQDGEKITGKYKGALGEADLTGKLKDNKIEFEFSTDMGKIVYTGTVEKDKDTMKGTAKYGEEATATWTAKREPPAKKKQKG